MLTNLKHNAVHVIKLSAYLSSPPLPPVVHNQERDVLGAAAQPYLAIELTEYAQPELMQRVLPFGVSEAPVIERKLDKI